MKKLDFKKATLLIIVSIAVIGAGYFGIQSLLKVDIENSTADSRPATNVDNAFSHLPYYDEDKLELYDMYQQNNSNLTIEDIVTHVNMGIDVPFFTRNPIIIENPDAIDVLVNKVYKFPDGWEPDLSNFVWLTDSQRMHYEAAEAFKALSEACVSSGFTIQALSTYRSYDRQDVIYHNNLNQYGEEYTNQYSARPGHSEHQSGLAVDVGIDGGAFVDIESNSNYQTFLGLLEEFGFIVRYPKGKEHLTGYAYEPWHIRYLGSDLAKKVSQSDLTYDEYVARLGN
jgi:D-alanyl-D-alanine carboxypeptidase